MGEATAAVVEGGAAIARPMPIDPAFLRKLFDDHFDFIWRLLARRGVAEADVDDAAQQVFMVVATRSPLVIKPGSERAFLFGVAIRMAQLYRRTHSRRREVAEGELREPRDEGPRPDELADRRQACEQLDRILDQMPEDIRTAFILFELEEMTMKEISSTLDVPQGTVASRIRRGREIFQQRVAEGTARARTEGGGS